MKIINKAYHSLLSFDGISDAISMHADLQVYWCAKSKKNHYVMVNLHSKIMKRRGYASLCDQSGIN